MHGIIIHPTPRRARSALLGGGVGTQRRPRKEKSKKRQKIQKNDPNVCKEQAYIWPVSLAHNPAWVIVRHLRQCAHRRPDSNSELWWCTCELWYIYSKISCENVIVGHGSTWILPWWLHSELFGVCFWIVFANLSKMIPVECQITSSNKSMNIENIFGK